MAPTLITTISLTVSSVAAGHGHALPVPVAYKDQVQTNTANQIHPRINVHASPIDTEAEHREIINIAAQKANRAAAATISQRDDYFWLTFTQPNPEKTYLLGVVAGGQPAYWLYVTGSTDDAEREISNEVYQLIVIDKDGNGSTFGDKVFRLIVTRNGENTTFTEDSSSATPGLASRQSAENNNDNTTPSDPKGVYMAWKARPIKDGLAKIRPYSNKHKIETVLASADFEAMFMAWGSKSPEDNRAAFTSLLVEKIKINGYQGISTQARQLELGSAAAVFAAVYGKEHSEQDLVWAVQPANKNGTVEVAFMIMR